MRIIIRHHYKEDGRWQCQILETTEVHHICTRWQPENGKNGSNWLIADEYGSNPYCCEFEQSKEAYNEIEIFEK